VDFWLNTPEAAMTAYNDPYTLTATMSFEGLCSLRTPTFISLSVTANVPRFGLAQAVKAYDYTNQRFITVDGRVASTQPLALDINLTSLRSMIVNDDRHMMVQVSWSPINDEDPSQDGWPHQLDRCNWTVQ
jgi:hypothetical protein